MFFVCRLGANRELANGQPNFDARSIARDQESRVADAASVGLQAAKPLFQYQTSIMRLWADNIEMVARHGLEAFTNAVEQQHNETRQAAE
jgi:hypothetical protein